MNRRVQTFNATALSAAASSSVLALSDFRKHLEQIDDSFSASLFLTLMGASATVGALAYNITSNEIVFLERCSD